jgi:RNA recognition motif-containing protein
MSLSDFKLFVGNMPADATKEEVIALFGRFGTLCEVFLMGGGRSKSGQSSAFVRYTTLESCEEAIDTVHMKQHMRRGDRDYLIVKYAKAQSRNIIASGPPKETSAPFSKSVYSLSSIYDSVDTVTPSTTPGTTPRSGVLPTPLSTPTSSTSSSSSSSYPVVVRVVGIPSYASDRDVVSIFCSFGRILSIEKFSEFTEIKFNNLNLEICNFIYSIEENFPLDIFILPSTKRPRLSEEARRLAEEAASRLLTI